MRVRDLTDCFFTRLRDLLVGERLKHAITLNEHALADLDAAVQEILKK